MYYITKKQFYLSATFAFILIFARTILLQVVLRETGINDNLAELSVGAISMYLLRVAAPIGFTIACYLSLYKKIKFTNMFGVVFLILFGIEVIWTIFEIDLTNFLYYIIIGALLLLCFIISSMMNKKIS